ncbi:hypothetical protein ABZ234_31805 [Nocardiopsis sp. NPDC006198]|uniref:hypothetical protein n=1 Tax=Nocardiopsis sp. NPDC006198 TaxID=3154472 RepID=UPI0033A10846
MDNLVTTKLGPLDVQRDDVRATPIRDTAVQVGMVIAPPSEHSRTHPVLEEVGKVTAIAPTTDKRGLSITRTSLFGARTMTSNTWPDEGAEFFVYTAR